ncbi:CaiB/BaiF CoA transferase family protein [Bordetella petrii]|uniref:CaiB/BaiF CoA transferase family protein n=1 Tax=Bordetella petrii TaxID=94624 RepID=UPI001E3CF26F|nr:CoA transferase [Bordetella petrii]MCD0502650.1 CoA transferase [Bordetella petrii]
MSQLPLRGLRVIDFTWIGAGSFTTKLLADFGADVIKIESGQRLDSLREAKPFKDGRPGVNRSGYFADRNSSKRSITLNLKLADAREVAWRLIDGCDVVANNFTPGTMERLGLGYQAVRERNPGAVYLAMSMQGDSGPQANFLGYGLTMGALTGLQYLSGKPGREPAGTGTNFPDHVPNPTHGALAVLAALRHRRRTGQGQYIDLAQIEPTIALLGPAVLDYTANGHVAGPDGNRQISAAPRGAYPCRGQDRWIAISACEPGQWRALQDVLGEGAGLGRPQYQDTLARWRNRDALDSAIAAATANWDADTLTHSLQQAGVPAGRVATAADVLNQDPQLLHREHFRWREHAEMGRTVYSAPPFTLSRTPGDVLSAAPLLGEHTEQVCREVLNMTDAQIDALRTQGVFQ